MNMQVKSM